MPVTIDGSNTPTAGGVIYGDGTEYASTAAGTSGQVLQSNGASAPSWVAAPTTSPAGSNTQIQYNNSGAFGASSTLTYDGNVINNTQANGTNSYIRTKSGTVDAYYGAATSGLGTIGVAGTFSNNDLVLYANSAERLRIGTAGQFGIGGANYGTSGQVLTSAGTGAAPTWTTPSAGALVFISSQTVSSAVANVNFTSGISSTYDEYMILFDNVKSSVVNNELCIRLYKSGSVVTTDYNYQYGEARNNTTSSLAGAGNGASNYIQLNSGNTGTGTFQAGRVFLYNVNVASANACTVITQTAGMGGSAEQNYVSQAAGSDFLAAVVTGIRFYWGSGANFSSGTFRLYGVAKS